MNILLSIHWVLAASVWFVGGGILHDIFVLRNNEGAYSRDLLRLMMDGHLLITCGAVLFVCYLMLLSKIQCGATIGIIVASSVLIYCAMIFPFLKSYGTMALSVMVIIVCIKAFQSFPDIWQVMQPYR